MKNKVYRENKEYREINKYGGKGNIGKLGKFCWGNEEKDLKKVVRCMVFDMFDFIQIFLPYAAMHDTCLFFN